MYISLQLVSSFIQPSCRNIETPFRLRYWLGGVTHSLSDTFTHALMIYSEKPSVRHSIGMILLPVEKPKILRGRQLNEIRDGS